MSKIPSDDVQENLYKSIIRESAQLEFYDIMEIYQKKKLKTMVKRQIRIFDHEILTPDTRKSKQEQWSRIESD